MRIARPLRRDWRKSPGVYSLGWEHANGGCARFAPILVWPLNDPVMVRLADGRYRIDVAALVDDTSPGAPSDRSDFARRLIRLLLPYTGDLPFSV